MGSAVDQFQPGQRVTVVQQIRQRERTWTTRVTGTVVRYEQAKTGSWFAHARDDRLWLDRLILRKDDGELAVCILDQSSHVEVGPASAAATGEPTSDVGAPAAAVEAEAAGA
jgi:hypothetical protein